MMTLHLFFSPIFTTLLATEIRTCRAHVVNRTSQLSVSQPLGVRLISRQVALPLTLLPFHGSSTVVTAALFLSISFRLHTQLLLLLLLLFLSPPPLFSVCRATLEWPHSTDEKDHSVEHSNDKDQTISTTK